MLPPEQEKHPTDQFTGIYMMYLSKGCKCEEVVLCLCFCCYFLLAAGLITDPTEGILIFLSLLVGILFASLLWFTRVSWSGRYSLYIHGKGYMLNLITCVNKWVLFYSIFCFDEYCQHDIHVSYKTVAKWLF